MKTSNADFPVRSSYTITPRDHESTAPVLMHFFTPDFHTAITSGAAYASVKLRGPSLPISAAQPKSMRVHWFSRGSHITLAGLRSR